MPEPGKTVVGIYIWRYVNDLADILFFFFLLQGKMQGITHFYEVEVRI